MARLCILVAAGVLIFGSQGRAQDGYPQTMPAPTAASAELALPTPYPVGCAPESCCDGCGCRIKRSFWEWLTFRSTRTGHLCCRSIPECRRPPLYAWFVDYCEVGGGTAYVLRMPAPEPCGCGYPR